MGVKEMMAHTVASKLRKGVEFQTACCEVFADEGIADVDIQAQLMCDFGSILGKISVERQRQRGFRSFKKPPRKGKTRKKSLKPSNGVLSKEQREELERFKRQDMWAGAMRNAKERRDDLIPDL